MNIVIMAGGGGTRLWPVSREKTPKQFTRLVGNRTLLQLAFDRAKAATGDVHRIVVTTQKPYAREVQRQLPRLPRANLLVEPVKRDTAPSVGLAAAFFAARGQHDEPLIRLPADHIARNEALYRLGIRAEGVLLRAHNDRTVLLGAEPTYPETGLGYIERGTRTGRALGLPVHMVRRFVEKPKLALARRYVRTGRFLWNMGVYGWRVGHLLELLHEHEPAIARRLDRIQRLFATRGSQRAIDREYRGMPSIAIDYAVTEKQDPSKILVLPGDYGWTDIGHWATLAEILGARTATEVKRGAVVSVKSRGNFVYCDAPAVLGLVGVQDLIVVATPDALLVCDKNNAQDVRALVTELARRGHRRFL